MRFIAALTSFLSVYYFSKCSNALLFIECLLKNTENKCQSNSKLAFRSISPFRVLPHSLSFNVIQVWSPPPRNHCGNTHRNKRRHLFGSFRHIYPVSTIRCLFVCICVVLILNLPDVAPENNHDTQARYFHSVFTSVCAYCVTCHSADGQVLAFPALLTLNTTFECLDILLLLGR